MPKTIIYKRKCSVCKGTGLSYGYSCTIEGGCSEDCWSEMAAHCRWKKDKTKSDCWNCYGEGKIEIERRRNKSKNKNNKIPRKKKKIIKKEPISFIL